MPVSGEQTDDQVMDSVAKAVADAAETVNQRHAAPKATSQPGLVSRVGYNTAYGVAFAVVYPVAFVANMLPQDNPVTDGLRDGARAVMETLKRP
jgi:hypothetical protein